MTDSADDLGEALGGVLVPRPMDRMRRRRRGRGSTASESRGGVGGRGESVSRLRLPLACSTMADSSWAVLRRCRGSWRVRKPWGNVCM